MANRYNVLFVCTGNAARSVMAEAILSRAGGEQFAAYSAGSHPAARVHPEALWQMEAAQMGAGVYRTKSWEMFAWPGAPRMDFVFTLCEDVAGRPRPKFAGNPAWLHLSIPDPEAGPLSQEDRRKAFGVVFGLLNDRIQKMVLVTTAARGKEDLGKDFERIAKSTRRVAAGELKAGVGAGSDLAGKPGLSTDLMPA